MPNPVGAIRALPIYSARPTPPNSTSSQLVSRLNPFGESNHVPFDRRPSAFYGFRKALRSFRRDPTSFLGQIGTQLHQKGARGSRVRDLNQF